MATLCSKDAGAPEKGAGEEVGNSATLGDVVELDEASMGATVEFGLDEAVAGANVENGAKVKTGTCAGTVLGATVVNGAKVTNGTEFGNPDSGSLGVTVGVSKLPSGGDDWGARVGEVMGMVGAGAGTGLMALLLLLPLIFPFFFELAF